MAILAHTVSTHGPLDANDAMSTGNIPPEVEPARQAGSGQVNEDDDDNSYQKSDEALPSDSEEAAIRRDPSRENGRFDEI